MTIETSLINANPKLYEMVKPEGVLMEGVRVTVANRLAREGGERGRKGEIFSRHVFGGSHLVMLFASTM